MHHDPIRLIAGLGNPGPEHQLNRHNVGFWFVDALARAHGGVFRAERKFHGDLCRLQVGGADIRVLKPMTYMNRNGIALQSVAAYLGIPAPQILVIHDDLDLQPGTVRLKRGGGHGGHNGLRDTIAHIGSDFFRMRFGIGHPGIREDVIEYVLRRAGKEDEEKVLEAIGDALEVIPILLGHGDQKAMHKLHSRGVTPKPYRKEGEKPDEGNERNSGEGGE